MSGARGSDPELVAALPELLALLAHDLKNPLAAVLANLGFLQSALAGEADLRDAIVDARLASEVLQRIVGNLELLGRELGDADRDRRSSDFAVPPLLDEVCAREREHADGRHLLLVVQDDPSADELLVRADRERVQRTLANLLANAVQHAPSGSEITIGCRREGARLEIVIADDGPIVPADLRAVVASPSGQASSKGRAEGRYGRGLALLVAGFAARHEEGGLEIGERDGRSALVLRLPLAPSPT